MSEKNIDFYVGSREILNESVNVNPMQVFDDKVLTFLDVISDCLLASAYARQHGELLTFGFWCRKYLLLERKKDYEMDPLRIGRGVAFHITSSNIPLMFAYSLVLGLLSGNVNIVRLSNNKDEQNIYLCNLINELLTEFEYLRDYICCLSYDKENEDITRKLSSICDARILWGSDSSINMIKKIEIPIRSVELSFTNRYSLCIIKCNCISELSLSKKDIKNFYNDTYLNDQRACSAPRFLYWLGTQKEIKSAKKIFWNKIEEYVCKNYDLKGINAVNKFETICEMAINDIDMCYEVNQNNSLIKVWINKITQELINYDVGGGFFLESGGEDFNKLKPLLSSKCQTISYLGNIKEELINFIITNGIKGVDRIVPMGKTLDFSQYWDGYDTIRSLSRVIVLL